jgi:outer membrane protein assembly factor BamA
MFSSIHSQRFLKYIFCKKKYVVNIEVKVGNNYTFKDVIVEAHTKSEAKKEAKQLIKQQLEIIVKGSRSLGKIKKLNEF